MRPEGAMFWEIFRHEFTDIVFFLNVFLDPGVTVIWTYFMEPHWGLTLVDLIYDPITITIDQHYFFLQSSFFPPPGANYDAFRDLSSSMYDYIPTWIVLMFICLNTILVVEYEAIFSIIYISHSWNIMFCDSIEISL